MALAAAPRNGLAQLQPGDDEPVVLVTLAQTFWPALVGAYGNQYLFHASLWCGH